MTIVEAAKELNETFKSEKEKTLTKRINELEKIIINLANRVEYLESKCQ